MTEMSIDSHDPLGSAGWVQRLGRALAAEGLAADDAVQDAWVAVLEGRMRRPASPAAWFVRVARNFGRMARRHEESVHRSERAAARPEAAPEEAADVVARAEVVGRVVAAVLELREPYRTTLLLRYLDELSAEEIAARQGVPGSTVRNRLRRGLEEVRQRFGGRMPLGAVGLWGSRLLDRFETTRWGARPLEFWTVTKSTKIAVASLVTLLLGTWGWWRLDGQATPPPAQETLAAAAAPRPAAAPVPDAARETRDPVVVPRRETPGAASAVAPAVPAPEAPGAATTFACTVRVVGWDDAPVPDAEVVLEDEDGAADPQRTDALGRCVLRHVEGTTEVSAFDAEVGIARAALVFSPAIHGEEIRLRLQKPLRVTGIVLDPLERPVPGATVEPSMQGMILTEDMPFVPRALQTDAEGRFELLLHANGLYGLEASHDGARSQPLELSKFAGLEQEVVLRLMGAFAIEGRLVDFGGDPVPDGSVRIDSKVPEEESPSFSTSARTDAQGRFRFAVPGPGDFLLVGSSPRAVRTPLDVNVGATQTLRTVELVLDPPEAITGTVLWEDGRPAAGCRVEAWSDDLPMPGDLGFELTPGIAPGMGFAVAETDLHGAFELAPLRAGVAYSLALQPGEEREARVRFHAIEAGTVGIELRISDDLLRGAFVRGTLSSGLGMELANVRMQLMWRGPDGGGWSADRPRTVLTGTGPWRPFDEPVVDGHFELAHLIAGREYVLYVTADGHGTGIVGPWIASDSGTAQDLVLGARQDLVVELVHADGRPAARATASLFYLEPIEPLQFFGERYADENGVVVFEDLLAGVYSVQAGQGGALTRREVTLAPGAPRTLVVVTLD